MWGGGVMTEQVNNRFQSQRREEENKKEREQVKKNEGKTIKTNV